MFAIISQPLWRKNAACGLWSTVGMASIFSADMSAQRLPDEIGGEKAICFYGSDFKNFKSRSFPRSSSASEIHSSAVCACAMSPGPNTTLGIPPADKIAASQKKWTPRRFGLAGAFQKFLDERQFVIRFQRQRWREFRAGNFCGQFSRAQQRGDFIFHFCIRFARQRSAIHRDFANVRNDVRLRAAGNRADIHRRRAEQRMFSLPQLRGVIRFQQIHDARHFVDGIFAELRRRAVRRLAARFEFQPQAALVRGDDLQFCRLADDGQIRLESAFRQSARTGLRVFLVNQSGENNFRFERTRFCIPPVRKARKAWRRRSLSCRTRRGRKGGRFCAAE